MKIDPAASRWVRRSLIRAVAAAVALAVAGTHTPTGAHPPAIAPAAGHAALPASCGDGGEGCTEEVVGDGGWKMQVFRNVSLAGSSTVTRAVIVIHGTGRNAKGYFASMAKAARDAGVADHTLVLSPWFKTSQDNPADDEATWTNDAWKIGEESSQGLSSFAAMDQLLATLASKQRFPNLTHIVLAGHSAGGQFVQRYAALGLAPNGLPGTSITYVPANPSSYLYFDPRRPTNTTEFGTPSGCQDYDTYKYGLQGRSGYVAQLSAEQALATYSHREVTIINGGEDTVDNGDLDQDCGAMAQGTNRAERGANYLRYLKALAPDAPHTRIVVNGVDHDGEAIFTAPDSRAALFGTTNTTARPLSQAARHDTDGAS